MNTMTGSNCIVCKAALPSILPHLNNLAMMAYPYFMRLSTIVQRLLQ